MPRTTIQWFRRGTNERVTKSQVIAEAKKQAIFMNKNYNLGLQTYLKDNFYYVVKGERKNGDKET